MKDPISIGTAITAAALVGSFAWFMIRQMLRLSATIQQVKDDLKTQLELAKEDFAEDLKQAKQALYGQISKLESENLRCRKSHQEKLEKHYMTKQEIELLFTRLGNEFKDVAKALDRLCESSEKEKEDRKIRDARFYGMFEKQEEKIAGHETKLAVLSANKK